MCGIVGQVNNNKVINPGSFEKMLGALARRGPDGSGVRYFNEDKAVFGHRRLSIIDLSSAGDQPMCNEDGTLWLTFNGEIYNYQVLRQELIKSGHNFRSQSDSEVIIHAYEEWGASCVKKLRGIFAFGIFDTKSNDLFIARDHFGVKPLYYHLTSEHIIFASSPSAILESDEIRKSVDPQAFGLYLGHGNIPGEFSIYSGVKKLLPGHSMFVRNGKAVVTAYWQAAYKPVVKDYATARDILTSLIPRSIIAQSVSDVRVGSLLSGGIDSTIVTSVLSEDIGNGLDTYTIGFDDPSKDESAHATLVARSLHAKSHIKQLTYEAACSLVPQMIEAYDEPFHLNGVFPYYAVSKLVKDSGVKVVLGGDGADEMFAGYNWYDSFAQSMNTRGTGIMSRINRKLFGPPPYPSDDGYKLFFEYNGYMKPAEQPKFIGTAMTSYDPEACYDVLKKHWNPEYPTVLAAQFVDLNCFMVDHCLTKVDRASMACGVEVRVPFLDNELVDAIFGIDHQLIYNDGERKVLLKQAMEERFPKDMDTMRKKGFSSPIETWLKMGFEKSGYDLIKDGYLVQQGLLNGDAIRGIFHGLHHRTKMMLISAELWSRRWMANDPEKLIRFSGDVALAGNLIN